MRFSTLSTFILITFIVLLIGTSCTSTGELPTTTPEPADVSIEMPTSTAPPATPTKALTNTVPPVTPTNLPTSTVPHETSTAAVESRATSEPTLTVNPEESSDQNNVEPPAGVDIVGTIETTIDGEEHTFYAVAVPEDSETDLAYSAVYASSEDNPDGYPLAIIIGFEPVEMYQSDTFEGNSLQIAIPFNSNELGTDTHHLSSTDAQADGTSITFTGMQSMTVSLGTSQDGRVTVTRQDITESTVILEGNIDGSMLLMSGAAGDTVDIMGTFHIQAQIVNNPFAEVMTGASSLPGNDIAP